MRRIAPVLIVAVVVLLGLAALGHNTTARAQDATPAAAAMAGHPLVGSWIVSDPGGTPAMIAFTADGIVIDTEIDGITGIGSWQPTGDRTANVTFVLPTNEPGFSGIIVIRAAGEVSADGATFTAPYSVTGVGADGSVVFSDQGQVTAVRLPVEPVDAAGTPIAGFPTWTPEEEGTPEAGTPTS
jgi:hypothetical protein